MHKHHSTPVHLGGIGPLQLLDERDHAYVHFHRFVSGEDRYFHPALLQHLDPWDRIVAKEKMSEVRSGEGNPMFGVEPTNKGVPWWTDGRNNVRSVDQPGPGWSRGMTDAVKNRKSGHTIFTNGEVEVHDFECPEGFWKGRLKSSGKKVSVKILDTLTGETTQYESLKDCFTSLGVGAKVLQYALKTGKLINKRYLPEKG